MKQEIVLSLTENSFDYYTGGRGQNSSNSGKTAPVRLSGFFIPKIGMNAPCYVGSVKNKIGETRIIPHIYCCVLSSRHLLGLKGFFQKGAIKMTKSLIKNLNDAYLILKPIREVDEHIHSLDAVNAFWSAYSGIQEAIAKLSVTSSCDEKIKLEVLKDIIDDGCRDSNGVADISALDAVTQWQYIIVQQLLEAKL